PWVRGVGTASITMGRRHRPWSRAVPRAFTTHRAAPRSSTSQPRPRGLPGPQTLLSERDLAAVNERLERCDPSEIVRWALLESGLERIAGASAVQAHGACGEAIASGER